MNRARQAIVGLWAALGGLSVVGGAAASTPSGLLSSTVCVSALTFGVILLTPTATLSDYATRAVRGRMRQQS